MSSSRPVTVFHESKGVIVHEYTGSHPNPAGMAHVSCHNGNHYNSVRPLDDDSIGMTNNRIWGDDQNEELILYFEANKLDPRATSKSYLEKAYIMMSESTQALGLQTFLRKYPQTAEKYINGDWKRKWCSHTF